MDGAVPTSEGCVLLFGDHKLYENPKGEYHIRAVPPYSRHQPLGVVVQNLIQNAGKLLTHALL